MKHLIQAACRNHWAWLNLSLPVHTAYCKRHGFAGYMPIPSAVDAAGFSPSSVGAHSLLRFLVANRNTLIQNGETVVYLDADTLIVNQDIDLDVALPVGADLAILGGSTWVNSGVMMMRAGPKIEALLTECFRLGPVRPNNRDFDLRLSALIHSKDFEVETAFLDDKWNWFDKFQGSPRPVTCLQQNAIIRHWASVPKNQTPPEDFAEACAQQHLAHITQELQVTA